MEKCKKSTLKEAYRKKHKKDRSFTFACRRTSPSSPENERNEEKMKHDKHATKTVRNRTAHGRNKVDG